MAIKRTDYPQNLSDAARSVMIELAHILGEYRDVFVIIGGWVPEILLSREGNPHVGSIDVDLALNHVELDEPKYNTIRKLLVENDYIQSDEQPFIFYRRFRVGDEEMEIQVDFLAGEYGGTGKSRRTQRVQDMLPRKARGADLVFEMNEEVDIEGVLPSGAKDRVAVRVASIPSFLAMKGIALKDRKKEKDAYHIYYTIRSFPGGVDALVASFGQSIENPLVREGLTNIAEAFSSIDSVGPIWVGEFEDTMVGEDREILIRDAYERVSLLTNRLLT